MRPHLTVSILTFVSAFAFAGGAAARDLVVVEAVGLRLPAGQLVDGTKPLELLEGQSITLLTTSGQVVRLQGPWDAPPDRDAKGGPTSDTKAALTALITERKARSSEVGLVRGASVKLPDPWVVDVTHPGTSCVEAGKSVVLWRSQDLADVPVSFAPKDRSWNISGRWPKAADRLVLPGTLPLKDHTDYVVDVDGLKAPVTVRVIPPSVANDAMRVGYMNEVGCDNQVEAFLTALPN